MFGCGHMCKLYQRTVTNKGDLNGTTRFLWGGQSNWQCLEERDSGGDLVARYTYATGYIDAVAVQERDLNGDDDFADDDEVVYYHSNTLYSVYALSDADENVVERMRYDAYGAATVLDSDFSSDADGASDVENPYTFTGRRLDTESDLMQYRNRYYDPGLGRFISRDPLGYVDTLGLFVYAGNNPAHRADPMGDKWWEWVPIASTIGHFFADVPGEYLEDYNRRHAHTREDCRCSEDVAIEKCKRKLRKQMAGFLGDWIGVPLGSDFLRATIGLTATQFAKAVAKHATKHGARLGGRAVVGGYVTGGVLAVDAAADAGIIVGRAVNVYRGYRKAVGEYCKCP